MGLFFKKVIISIIGVYQAILSPQTGLFRFIYKTPIGSLNYNSCPGCRFWPTCSQYSKQAFKEYPLGEAVKLSGLRILKCRGDNLGGVDHLPTNRK